MRPARALIVLGLVAVAIAPAAAQAGTHEPFRRLPFPAHSWSLFDLGVTDLDGDGDLDAFSTNHDSLGLLLENDGAGAFADATSLRGFDQDPAFPGWDDDVQRPDTGGPGLYLHRSFRSILVRSGERQADRIRGAMTFLTGVEITERRRARARTEQVDARTTRLRFSLAPGGRLELAPALLGLPLAVHVREGVAAGRIFVGPRRVSPQSLDFSLHLQDRHGSAWADFDRDGLIDALVVRGGLKGRIDDYADVVHDELLLRRGGGYVDSIAGSGLAKGGCRSRSVAAPDADGDGDLDVFVACRHSHPRLFTGTAAGTFADATHGLGFDGVAGSRFRWLDLDDQPGLELLAYAPGTVTAYAREGSGAWTAVAQAGAPEAVEQLASADFDADGDADVFLAGRAGSALLEATALGLRRRDPRELGLPAGRVLAAAWLDHDDDGRLDLFTLPQGLFVQRRSGAFRRDYRAPPAAGAAAEGRVSAADVTGDGSRDLLLAWRRRESERRWELRLLENRVGGGHWLQVDLRGPEADRQALGATVSLQAMGKSQWQWVGQNEGSRHSQGHYRLYFGLGRAQAASDVTVRWPDGSVLQLGDVAADQRLSVAYAAGP